MSCQFLNICLENTVTIYENPPILTDKTAGNFVYSSKMKNWRLKNQQLKAKIVAGKVPYKLILVIIKFTETIFFFFLILDLMNI